MYELKHIADLGGGGQRFAMDVQSSYIFEFRNMSELKSFLKLCVMLEYSIQILTIVRD